MIRIELMFHFCTGNEVYRLTENGIYPGYPKKIISVFSGLPSNIDGAFTWSNDKTYFFKVKISCIVVLNL